jgi:cyclase
VPTFTGEPRLDEIADGVHAFLQPDGGWCLNNAGLVRARGRSLLIDTAATEARARLLRASAMNAVGAPPGLLLNTHAHGDHTFGNFVFPEAVTMSHERTRREAAQVGLHLTTLWPEVEWGAIDVVLPDLTFTGRTSVYLDGQEIELHSFGPAHSVCDTVVWLPRQRVLFTGDLVMSGVTPFVLTGSVSGLRSAVARLREFGALTVVPGHGPVGGPELLDATENYLAWLTALARDCVTRGITPLAAAREARLDGFASLLDSERLAPNLHRACQEARGDDAAIGIDRMMEDMIALHGGLPRCAA